MGSEDLFRKRKARAAGQLQRQQRERARNKRYLIVCEGTKTEQVVSALKTKPGFAKYGTGQKGVYGRLKTKLDDALNHAERLRKHGAATASINPATDVDELVLAIRELQTK